MLAVASDTRVKALLEKGRKERSDAFFAAFRWLKSPKLTMRIAKRAVPKQHCPGLVT